MASHFRPRTVAPAIVVVGLIAAAIYALVAAGAGSGDLTASGTVEAQEIRLGPEIAGRVVEVLVSDGDPVRAGDALVRMDDRLLLAQRERLVAALSAAEAAVQAAEQQQQLAGLQLQAALAAARAQDRPRQDLAWQLEFEPDLDLPTWYFSEDEQLAVAEAEVDGASAAAAEAESELQALLDVPANRELRDAETSLARSRAAFLTADAVYRRAYAARDPEELFDEARQRRDQAEQDLDQAETTLRDLLDSGRFDTVLRAREGLAIARARQLEAEARREALRTGDRSLPVRLAQAQLSQADAAQVQVSRLVDQTRADLAALDVQLERSVLRAPSDGVVLSRTADPGEVLPAGGTALTLGRLADLTITVFLPEDRYGQVRLGDPVEIRVDSFPDQVFQGRVARIADRAEFTPRNVQTEEGRRTTVFAIEIAIVEPGDLKPGMPADVRFGTSG